MDSDNVHIKNSGELDLLRPNIDSAAAIASFEWRFFISTSHCGLILQLLQLISKEQHDLDPSIVISNTASLAPGVGLSTRRKVP